VAADGTFSFTAKRAVAHRLVARTGDGHEAEWTVRASELADEVASSSSSVDTEAAKFPDEAVRVKREALGQLVERAVSRELGPLRAELRAYRNRARLGDILGGVGIIVGIAGLISWCRARQLRSGS
jgi:nickel transport protein